MLVVLADDEARLGVLAALENRSRAEMPVDYPQLSRAGTIQQRQDAGAWGSLISADSLDCYHQ